ncbi:GMP/IMP nucleotidase YrfG (plasmid) [Piscirickettsia salmonis]|uniref:hypothetical protein n=1 Tax=Piscirickettsia salmonis TaxID=1238 RepID=UPI0012BA7B29|nr:hypothetical protein [Piscirickettsia salmonis]QGP57140.1 GMP/IMP nucleotidase YrfG [Piscirickettsia salmonis]QGP61914.1 GMP/IMP nucleotidase YrfG [Piscirickettsia salmonis]QGP66690.1 GMP/IMP nucleotidase YrfG [Piscirickettsia salmonis]
MSVLGLERYIDAVHISHQYGVAKESIEFWHAVQSEIPFDMKKSLFIDDSVTVLRTAKKYGISNLLAISTPCSKGEVTNTQEFTPVDNLGSLISKFHRLN